MNDGVECLALDFFAGKSGIPSTKSSAGQTVAEKQLPFRFLIFQRGPSESAAHGNIIGDVIARSRWALCLLRRRHKECNRVPRDVDYDAPRFFWCWVSTLGRSERAKKPRPDFQVAILDAANRILNARPKP